MGIRELAIVFLLFFPFTGVADDRFVSKLTLPTGQTLVVAEGDLEARSIGSFSVRLYKADETPDETAFFTSGLFRERDGFVEDAILADINGDGQWELIVIVRSAGSGGYRSAHAFAIKKDKVVFLAMREGIVAHADPIAALRRSMPLHKEK